MMHFRQLCRYLGAGGVALFLLVFLVLPVYTVVEQGLRWNLVLEIFRNPIYVEGLRNAFAVALVTTLLVFCIALPLALVFDRWNFPGKSFSAAAIMAPMILPPFVGALGFQQILGHYGVVNTLLASMGMGPVDFLGGEGRFWSVCAIEALHLYPILYLNLVTALGNIDPALQESAANLGATPWRRFRKITLPLLRPGLLAGGSLVLVWSFTELGTPLMFGFNRITPVQIFNGLTELETNPLPYTLVTLMLVFSAGLYLLSRLLLRSRGVSGSVKGNTGSGGNTPDSWRKWLPTGLFALITFLATLPHLALLLTAFSRDWYGEILPRHLTLLHFENALSNAIVVPSIINSLRYSTLAVLFAVAAGLLIALAAVRWKLKGSGALDLLSMLPMAVPGIVIAFGFLGMAVKYNWARAIFNPEQNPLLLLAIAYAVRRLPYVVRAVSSGLEQIPEEFENAARNLGAGTLRVFRKITLPLVGANLLVGGLFAFSFSMLEVSDSLILAQKAQFYPITRAIFELSQILGSGPFTGCAFGVWAMVFLAATLGGASVILGKKIGTLFRF